MKYLSCVFFWGLKLVTAFRASGSQRFLPGNSCLLAPKEKGKKWDLRGFSQRERLSTLLDDFILLCFHFPLHLPADSWITPGCFKKGSSLVGRGGGSRKDCVFWSLLTCLIILYTVLCKKLFWNFYRIFFYTVILQLYSNFFHLQLFQNTGYIPRVIQYIPVSCLFRGKVL